MPRSLWKNVLRCSIVRIASLLIGLSRPLLRQFGSVVNTLRCKLCMGDTQCELGCVVQSRIGCFLQPFAD